MSSDSDSDDGGILNNQKILTADDWLSKMEDTLLDLDDKILQKADRKKRSLLEEDKLLSKNYEDLSIKHMATSLEQTKIAKQDAAYRLENYNRKREMRLKEKEEAEKQRRAEFEERLEENKGIRIGRELEATATTLEQKDAERDRQLRELQKQEEEEAEKRHQRNDKIDHYLEDRFERTKRVYEKEQQELEAERAKKQAEKQRKHDEEKAKKAEKKRKKEEMEKRRQARLAAKAAEGK